MGLNKDLSRTNSNHVKNTKITELNQDWCVDELIQPERSYIP